MIHPLFPAGGRGARRITTEAVPFSLGFRFLDGEPARTPPAAPEVALAPAAATPDPKTGSIEKLKSRGLEISPEEEAWLRAEQESMAAGTPAPETNPAIPETNPPKSETSPPGNAQEPAWLTAARNEEAKHRKFTENPRMLESGSFWPLPVFRRIVHLEIRRRPSLIGPEFPGAEDDEDGGDRLGSPRVGNEGRIPNRPGHQSEHRIPSLRLDVLHGPMHLRYRDRGG